MLQERLLQTIEKREDIDQRRLAGIAGVNESTISRYLNGYDEIGFEYALKIVKHLYPEQQNEIMAEYAVTQRNQNARYALEYCIIARLDETADQLIENLHSSGNPDDKEWANMYQLVRLYQNNSKEYEQLLNRIEIFHPKSVAMQALKRIVRGIIFFDLNDYHSLSLHIKGTDRLIENIKTKFIRDCFNIRLGMFMYNVHLYSNNVEQARYYNSLVLEQEFFENVKEIGYLHHGYSYMFEDYDTASKYFNVAHELFIKQKNEKLANLTAGNISFLQSYWKIDYEFNLYTDNRQNLSNYIFYLIQKGNILEAKELLNHLDMESLTDWEKAIHYYYIGLVDKDTNAFYRSVQYFREAGDLFHLQLPMQVLNQLGENKIVLEMLAK